MQRIDVDERDGNYIVTFELKGAKEEDLIITSEGNSIRVIASTKRLNIDINRKNADIDFKSVYYDKTAILPDDADFSGMRHVFFAGWLEVTVLKKK